jgi:hypothetical protein
VWADSGVARLGFGDGENARVAAQRPVTTIKARGLSLPAPGIARADYDQAERLGVATLKLIAAYAMRLVAGVRLLGARLEGARGCPFRPRTAAPTRR